MPSNTLLLLLLITLISATTASSRSQDSPTTLPKVAKDAALLSNHLAISLFRRMASVTDDDVLLSPYSIATALSMVYLGTRGDTSAEIRRFFDLQRLGLHNSRLHEGFRALSHHLRASSPSLKTANVLLTQETYPVVPFYKYGLVAFYDAFVQPTRFESDAAAVANWANAWVRWKTGDGVRNVLRRPPDVDTSLMLLNVLHFRGKWANATSPTTSRYDPHLRADVLEAPYASSNLSFLTLSPRDPAGLRQLEQSLTLDTFKDLDVSTSASDVAGEAVRLPTLRIEEQHDLRSALMSMGLRSVFLPYKSDLTGISNLNDLYLSKVLHRVTVESHPEYGTRASALTFDDVESDVTSSRVTADRPFVFLIRDRPSNVVLFMGSVRKV